MHSPLNVKLIDLTNKEWKKQRNLRHGAKSLGS